MKLKNTGYCSNIKLSIRLPRFIDWTCQENELSDLTRSNKIIRSGDYTFTQYLKDRSTLHVTGVKSFQEIDGLCDFLSKKISFTVAELKTNLVINTSTWHLNIRHKIDLWDLLAKLPKKWQGKYLPGHFAGLTCKCMSTTAIVFSSGKINFFGVRKPQDFFRARIAIMQYIFM